MQEIGIIVVLFNPTPEQRENVFRLAGIFSQLVAVDNSAVPLPAENRPIHYIYNNGENMGIAEAQNIGIRYVFEHFPETEHILFLDQDSKVKEDFPFKMQREYQRILESRPKLAMLGPMVIDEMSGEAYRSVVHKDDTSDSGFTPRREIISSGSIVSKAVLNDVGMNLSDLFIDYVDFEWCWRAGSKGYEVGITPNVSIVHTVGQNEMNIFGYKIILSSPIRYFYQTRNLLWLCRMKHVPRQFKIANLVKTFARLIYFPFVPKAGFKRWYNICRGLKAGF